jgi:hypothetical protein
MMIRRLVLVVAAAAAVVGASAVAIVGCSGGTRAVDMGPDLARDPNCKPFQPAPECRPNDLMVQVLGGSRQLVVSSLAIAKFSEGFDLNCDGRPDNKLSPLGALANQSITDAFMTTHDIVLPIEMFGYTGADTACAKFAFYLGRVKEDRDNDGYDTTWEGGKADCMDTDPNVHPKMMEDLTNRLDDDCDGYADNTVVGTPGGDTQDLDGDGVSTADGDCDDRGDPQHIALAKSRHPAKPSAGIPAATEICGNGIDEDCNGIADDGKGCDPFGDNDLPVHVQGLSFSNFNANGILDGGIGDGGIAPGGLKPFIVFPDGKVSGGTLTAGPDLFELALNISGVDLTLTLSGAHVRMDLVDKANGAYVMQGLLGGVLEAVSLAQIHIDAGGVLKKEQSLLDGIFVGPAGTILGLDQDADGHYLPDIDVDGDGIETFWQENTKPNADGGTNLPHVDTCKDGDGTIVHNNFDGQGTQCALAKDTHGNYRFVDGLSTALRFTAVPAKLPDVVVK